MNFVSIPDLSLDTNTIKFLKENNIKYNSFSSINDIIKNTDVIYMTRIQKERFNSKEIDINLVKNNLYLTQEILTNAKDNIVIMHPLPRNEEISIDIDNDLRSAYFRQMENGLYVIMAFNTIVNLKNKKMNVFNCIIVNTEHTQ